MALGVYHVTRGLRKRKGMLSEKEALEICKDNKTAAFTVLKISKLRHEHRCLHFNDPLGNPMDICGAPCEEGKECCRAHDLCPATAE